MSRKAGVVTINLNAGTAKFMADMDAAAAKVVEFHSHGVSGAKAASASMKVLEGQTFNNSKAAEHFLETMLGSSGIMKAAFPVLSAVAFGSVVVELGTKVYEFYKNVKESGEKATQSFRDLNAPLRISNDELAVANARLEQDIAKLEGKPQNLVKVALEETRMAADQLADSLDRDLDRLNKVLDEEKIGFFKGLATGQASTSDLPEGVKEFRQKTQKISDEGSIEILNADTKGDPKAMEAARERLNKELIDAYSEEIESVRKSLADAKEQAAGKVSQVALASGEKIPIAMDPKDERSRIAQLEGMERQYSLERARIQLQARNGDLTKRKEGLTGDKDNADQSRPFADRMAAMNAQLDALTAKLSAIGRPESEQILAKSFWEAQKAIVEVNKALAQYHTHLTDKEEAEIVSTQQAQAQKEAEIDWATKMYASTTAIEARVKAQHMLADAIGKGYEATKSANVESRLTEELGVHATDPEWMAKHQPDIDKRRSELGSDFEAEHATQTKTAVDALQKQIELENALAAVQVQGAEAVRQATLAYRLRRMVIEGATEAQVKAEMDLYNARRANAGAGRTAQMDQQAAAARRLTDALIDGAEAERQVSLKNKYQDMERSGASDDEIEAQQRQDAADWQRQVTAEALKTGNAYRDQLTSIGQQIAALERLKEIRGNTFEIEVSMRDLENRRLETMIQQTLVLGNARDGVKAFFLEMQEHAESTATSIYRTLNNAFDRSTDQLSRLATGQKTDFGGMLRDTGQELVQSQVKNAARSGLSWIGKRLGVDVTSGQVDGKTESTAFWVRMAGSSGPGGGPKSAIDPGSWLGKILGVGASKPSASGGKGKVFGGALGHGVFSFAQSLFSGFRADGGGVDPGRAYVVGERGPEVFMPTTGGSVVPNGTAWGGTTIVQYHVDARGADLGAEGRIQRGLQMTHNAAVMNSVRAQKERQARTPRG